MKTIKSDQEIQDFVRGCTFMGTGGGGDPKDGIAWLTATRDDGLSIAWVDASDIPNDEWTVCPFLMGSIAPLTEEAKKRMKHLGLDKDTFKSIQAESVRLLEEYMDVKVRAIVPIELGGSNTPGAIAAAARLGISAVDGDYTGRAIPEVPQTTPYLEGLPLWPISSVDKYGNFCIIKESVGYEMAERIGKFIAAASFGLAGQAGFLFKGKDMKRVVIHKTLSRCMEIGHLIRTYYWGTHTISGEKSFKGKELKVWFKNENHVSWLDGKPYITSPDMLIVVDRDSGEPYVNSAIEEGYRVAVIGLHAIDKFQSPKGLKILGPRHFGFEIAYNPIEDLVS